MLRLRPTLRKIGRFLEQRQGGKMPEKQVDKEYRKSESRCDRRHIHNSQLHAFLRVLAILICSLRCGGGVLVWEPGPPQV